MALDSWEGWWFVQSCSEKCPWLCCALQMQCKPVPQMRGEQWQAVLWETNCQRLSEHEPQCTSFPIPAEVCVVEMVEFLALISFPLQDFNVVALHLRKLEKNKVPSFNIMQQWKVKVIYDFVYFSQYSWYVGLSVVNNTAMRWPVRFFIFFFLRDEFLFRRHRKTDELRAE